MSYIIKFVNEYNNKEYTNLEAVDNLIYYIYDICKTNYDSVRPGHAIGEFNGCIPFIGPEYMSHDPEEVDFMMRLHLDVYTNKDKSVDLIKHRIVSFHKYDLILPNDALNLAETIIKDIYKDYLSVYAVHLDKKYIHIHLAISTYNIWNGNRFDISKEYKRLDTLVHNWYNNHLDYIDKTCSSGIYDRYLFPEEATIKPAFGQGIVKRYQK